MAKTKDNTETPKTSRNPYPEFFTHSSISEIFGRFSIRNSGDENQLISVGKINK